MIRSRLRNRTAVRYAVAGFAINLAMYIVFVALYQVAAHLGAVCVSVAASVLVMPLSFALNRRFVFGSRALLLPELRRFLTVYLTAMGVSVVILTVLLRALPTPVLVTQAIAITVLVTGTFLGHNLWTFAHLDRNASR